MTPDRVTFAQYGRLREYQKVRAALVAGHTDAVAILRTSFTGFDLAAKLQHLEEFHRQTLVDLARQFGVATTVEKEQENGNVITD